MITGGTMCSGADANQACVLSTAPTPSPTPTAAPTQRSIIFKNNCAYDIFVMSNNGTPGACSSAQGIALQGGTTCKGGSACPAGLLPAASSGAYSLASAPGAQVRWNAYRYCNSDVSCSDGMDCVQAGACVVGSNGALLAKPTNTQGQCHGASTGHGSCDDDVRTVVDEGWCNPSFAYQNDLFNGNDQCCNDPSTGCTATFGGLVNNCNWGTLVEFTAGSTGFAQDSWNISVNGQAACLYGDDSQCPSFFPFFNIPVEFAPDDLQCSSIGPSGQNCRTLWCTTLDCPDAYQTPTMSGCSNGLSPQATCPQTYQQDKSLTVEFCPSGFSPSVQCQLCQ